MPGLNDDTRPGRPKTSTHEQSVKLWADVLQEARPATAKRDKVTREWRKLNNAELHALYSSPDIIRNIKSRRLRWAGHVARMGESINAYRMLVGRLEGKRLLGRPRRIWEDNIKMDLREVGYDDRDWINLAQDRDQWRAYVRAAMNLRVGEFFHPVTTYVAARVQRTSHQPKHRVIPDNCNTIRGISVLYSYGVQFLVKKCKGHCTPGDKKDMIIQNGLATGYAAYATLRQDFDWRNVIFSDDVIVCSSFVRRINKSGCVRVACWGRMSYDGAGLLERIHGRFTAEVYEHILANHLKLPSICSYWVEGKPRKKPQPGNLPRPGIEPGPPGFAARRASRYSTGVDANGIQRWFTRRRDVDPVEWPPNSPDMNPIQNLWAEVKRILRSNWAEQPPVRTPEELWDRVLDAWEEMPKNLDLFHNLVDSMPRRMRAVVDAGGLWTRY
ncbi:hypothetical protein ANN_12531 [Periplaneta americana]|uniref:Tc1-like transposase DDE domain-containing protein n=1 Tax=Periplaneta americana TaxID=6978 RepID=A0ABQ8TIS6_PERAM|nr:hypothetical protein ANN_12531 [Periplaneta americana]